MSRRNMAIVAVLCGIVYAVSSALRGHVLPGIVTGVLGAVLVFLVLGRVTEHNAAVRRRREREGG
jgi:L-lactate permease